MIDFRRVTDDEFDNQEELYHAATNLLVCFYIICIKSTNQLYAATYCVILI